MATLAAALISTPAASAAPDCSPAGVSSTVNSVAGTAQQYLSAHPEASAVVTQVINQPGPESTATMRGYFGAHPQEDQELRGILAPISETRRACNTTGLPPALDSAFATFMAG